MKKLIHFMLAISLVISGVMFVFNHSANADNGDLISDGIFGNENSMSETQINDFINSFPRSCLKPSNYPADLSPVTFLEPLGYSSYGGQVSAARVIFKAATLYHLNPQVILSTLEKEQGMVSGNTVYGGCIKTVYNSSMGYNCPDGSENALKDYANINVTRTCVAKESNVTFSRQVNHASWQLRFDKERAYGNLEWGGDGDVSYVGFMTEGNRARRNGGSVTYYDGYASIDGQSIKLQNGATAALYNYTPHFNSFQRIFSQWFGATHNMPIPGCAEATNTSLSCVWKMQKGSAELLSTSHDDVNWGVNAAGYGYSGVQFFVRNPIAPSAGNIAIYGMTKTDGSTFLTANSAEYDALKSSFTPKGIMFYADPPNSNTGYPVFRLYNNSTSSHVFTTSPEQYLSVGYQSEGQLFTSLSSLVQEQTPTSGQSLVYRFKDMPDNRHFWTSDIYERDRMIREGYHYDGVGWRSTQSTSQKPVYRLYSPTMQKHLYTTDAYERDVLDATSSWTYEGVTFYANSSTSGAPVYRLYRSQNAEHLYTQDAYERSELIRKGVFKDEGIAWYQP
jgi:hypothetical protein